MDEAFEKISLQDKIKMLEKMKKIKEAELKNKEEELKKEIEVLEERRKKDMKEMEDQVIKEEKTLDEEMMKALNELLFRERRAYTINRARVQRKLDFGSEGGEQMGESFLYSIADTMFSNANMKLRESIGAYTGRGLQPTPSRSYEGNASNLEKYSLETSSYNVDEVRISDSYRPPERDMNNYLSMKSSTLDSIDKDLENRRKFY